MNLLSRSANFCSMLGYDDPLFSKDICCKAVFSYCWEPNLKHCL
uniref:Uncharacterized protein n=1 Tax=Heterorhabditis bacteriophora TaxID=37862 RepID=A0A1I7XAY9_HETBA